MPKVKGDAKGLRKTPCMATPESPKSIPTKSAPNALGKRIACTIMLNWSLHVKSLEVSEKTIPPEPLIRLNHNRKTPTPKSINSKTKRLYARFR